MLVVNAPFRAMLVRFENMQLAPDVTVPARTPTPKQLLKILFAPDDISALSTTHDSHVFPTPELKAVTAVADNNTPLK